jgi:CheY-like chemotaxis protein
VLSLLWRCGEAGEKSDTKEERATRMARQMRVMVLDTSRTSRKILEVILLREGHRVVGFEDPVAALCFLSRHCPPDLLLLSIDLPRMDGYDVLKYLNGVPRLRSIVPIARLAGAQRVILKPLVRQQIIELTSAYASQLDEKRDECPPPGDNDPLNAGRCLFGEWKP